jgi:membrane protein implicated in regulation of membrane protease activity
MSITYWLFQAEVWLILALVLIIADIVVGLDFFVLPVGIAAAVVSAMLFAESRFWFSDTILLESWREVLIAFAILSVAAIFLIRKLFQRRNIDTPDINQY